jgi:hypothetical protein
MSVATPESDRKAIEAARNQDKAGKDQPGEKISTAAQMFSTAASALGDVAKTLVDPISMFAEAVGRFSDLVQPKTAAVGKAAGGHIRGPGSGTSDSIPAMLSDGEYVVKASAVSHWGVHNMHAINNMEIPKFSLGGIVGMINMPHFASGGAVANSNHTLDIRTDSGTFQAVVSNDTMRSLSQSALRSKLNSSGNKPSWYK